MTCIKESPDRINEIIGKKNKDKLKKYIEKAGVIIVAWGGVENLWDNEALFGYKKEIYESLKKNISKVWWFGANADGSPKHAASGKTNDYRRITEDEIRGVFRIKE